MPIYRVLSGQHRREDGTVAEAGDTVEMSEELRDRFGRDKFDVVESAATDETVSTGVSGATSETADGDGSVAPSTSDDTSQNQSESEASGDVPTDWPTLRQMGVVYEGDEVNGSSSKEKLSTFFNQFSESEVAELKRKAKKRMEE
jgi:hypothetical protein